jgi:hypothetical protein
VGSSALWPMPQFVNESSTGLSYLNKDDFKITHNLAEPCDIIDENVKLYTNILFPPKFTINSNIKFTEKMLLELNIELAYKECPSYPNSTMDESCKHFNIIIEYKKKKKKV